MADNKNQHYVSKFYMRHFAADEQRRSVNLLNIARQQVIPRASIRNQCSRDYWHGEPDPIFEESVRGLETIAAETIRSVIQAERLQRLRTLKTFAIFQLGRTAYSAEAIAEARRKIHQFTYGRQPEDEELRPRHNIMTYLMNSPIILDMAACLVVNQTEVDFITSDNPVALHNWWFHHIYRQRPGSGTGLAQAGLEIYLPLSPRHQLILYDRNIWSVPKANRNGTIHLRSVHDVLALNERQFLSAEHNVYFSSINRAEQVEKLAAECTDRRKTDKTRVFELVKSRVDHEAFVEPSSPEADRHPREKLILNEANEIEPQRRITFLSKRAKPRYCAHPSAVGALRDLAWMRIAEDFRDKLKKRKLNFTQLDEFVADHPLFFRVGSWKDEFWEMRRAS